jgi:dipeptidyl aminopeptidase/acylaminoacyl peptidase
MAAASESGPRAGTLTPAMIVGLRIVGDAAISPDGKRVAYVTSVPRAADDPPGVPYQEIWIVAANGGTARRYTPSKQRAWAPAFSPDGSRLAFLSTRPSGSGGGGSGSGSDSSDDSADLFVLDLDGGEAQQVTDGKLSVAAFRWSPDGSRCAFTAKDAKTDPEKKDAKEGRDFEVVDQNPKSQHLWSIDVATRTATRLTTDETNVAGFDWSPRGDRFVLQTTTTPRVDALYMYSTLALLPAAGGVPAPFVPTRGKLERPVFSPSGKFVAWLGANDLHDPYAGTVFVAPVEGGNAHTAAARQPWGRDVGRLEGRRDARRRGDARHADRDRAGAAQRR